LKPEAILAIVLATLVGCGSDGGGQTYSAASFVKAANAEDAGLELGEPLPFPRQGTLEVRVLRFTGTGAAPTTPGAAPPPDVHGSGTASVFSDDAAATGEYERCRAGGLICLRAANVALEFSGDVAPADLDRLSAALEALAAAG
jgi:hypothetical protein